MKMNNKNKIIICLCVIAVMLFSTIQFWILPTIQAKQTDYARNQTDALTHDILAVEKYRTPYVGNANNVCGLFEVLPLNHIPKKFEIDSENCTLTVNYLDTVWNIGNEKVQRDLIYNSAAAMAAIDNLSEIVYNFTDNSFCFTRTELEAVFSTPLSHLLEQENWSSEVQDRISSQEFCRQFYD